MPDPAAARNAWTLARVLAAGLGLDAGDDVDRVGVDGPDRLGDVLGRQPAGQHHRHLRAALGHQIPVEAVAGAAVHALAVGVEQVQVGAEGLGRLHVGGAADPKRLHHLGARAPRRLGAERRAPPRRGAGAGSAARARRRRTTSSIGALTKTPATSQRRFNAAPICSATPGSTKRGLSAMVDQPDRPGAERRRVLGVLEVRHAADLDLRHRSQGSQKQIVCGDVKLDPEPIVAGFQAHRLRRPLTHAGRPAGADRARRPALRLRRSGCRPGRDGRDPLAPLLSRHARRQRRPGRGLPRRRLGLRRPRGPGADRMPQPAAAGRLAPPISAAADAAAARRSGACRATARRTARGHISAHYDLGNDLFALYLDESMMYSCAWFPTPEASLGEAQQARLERICRALELGPDDHLLEIGTGWGGLAAYAASRYGCRVTTTTISREQREGALRRIADAGRRGPGHRAAGGLPRPARPLRQARLDRDDRGGRLAVLRRVLRAAARSCSTPDGLIFLQAIVIDDRLYEQEKAARSFSNTLIFPGGCLPSVEVIQRGHRHARPTSASSGSRTSAPTTPRPCATGASASSPTPTSPPSWATTSPSAASGPCGWR